MKRAPPRIVICDQEVVDSMAPLLREFMDKAIDLDADECLVTDESSLADFVPPPAYGGPPEAEVLDKIERLFGVRPAITDRLVVILGAIERLRATSLQ